MLAASPVRAFSVAGLAALIPTVALADDATFKGNETFVIVVIGLIMAFTVLALVWLRNAMMGSTWSLADALSEKTDVPYVTPTGTVVDATGKPITVSQLRASSSRLIALLGAIVILFMFLGFGAFALYQYGVSGKMPETGDILKFLAGGLALFVPYAANKVSSLGGS